MIRHRHSFLLTLVLLILAASDLKSQDIAFPCDSKFNFYQENWADNGINALYDSLNNINYSKIDFELRFWTDGNGQAGLTKNVFIMRHCIKGNKWSAFFYKGFKNADTHKTISEYFKNAEIKKYKDKEWKIFWDTLVMNNVLTLQPPSASSLEQTFNNSNPQYPEVVRTLPSTSEEVYYRIELIKKDCKRSYGFNDSILYSNAFNDLEEIKNFKNLVLFMNKKIN